MAKLIQNPDAGNTHWDKWRRNGGEKEYRSAKIRTVGMSGVNEAEIGSEAPVSEEWYDMTGRRVVNPGHGIFIKSQKYADGKVTCNKVAH